MSEREIDRAVILNVTLVGEAALLLVSAIWCFVAGTSLAAPMIFSAVAASMGVASGVLIAGFGFFLLALSEKYSSFSVLAQLRNAVKDGIAPLFSKLGLADIILIAMSSGFCEEVFFRGVLQREFGLLPASILFGLVHCAGAGMMVYAFWTFIAGLFLGWLYQSTNCLWTPILAHFTSNLIVLIVFRYRKNIWTSEP